MLLTRLAGLAVARRRIVLVTTALFLALAGVLGGGVAAELSGGGFDDPDAESVRAAQLLEEQFGSGVPNLVLLAEARAGVDDPAAVAAGEALVKRLSAEPGVVQVTSWWTSGRPDSLKAQDGSSAVVLARLTGGDETAVDRVEELAPSYRGNFQGLQVQVGGQAEVFSEVGHTIERDILRAEAIAIPITMVLLVIVFGSAVAAALPLLIGVMSILGTFLVLHLLAKTTDVSVYSVNLATSLGLGLGIDYALFMVTRHREELARGLSVPAAVIATVRTAGRTVLFSALTVLLSLSALLVFPLYFLRSFAYAGIAAVVFAALGAVVVLPAALAALGHRVDSLDLRRPLRRLLGLPAPRPKALDEGFWSRIAHGVMRRPLPVATSVVALLLLAAVPFGSVVFGLPDDRVLPKDAPAFQVAETLRAEYPGRESQALSVVAPRASGDPASYARALSVVDGVERVDAATGSWVGGRQVTEQGTRGMAAGGGTFLRVVPSVESYGPEGEQLVRDVRAVPSPIGEVLVEGQAASLVDTKSSLRADLPLALGLIFGTTFVLLFLFTGSLLIPVKALVLNVLSLCATFGAMVWVFQQGNLIGLVGDPVVTGTLDTTIPILMFCLLFGLSMDYEVFLLSRIKEVWDQTGDNTRAVAVGLQRTGRIVTAAAGLLAIVFLAFISSDISFIKLLGLGTALAIVVDATLIRGALVPAFMRLAGRANWWAPAPLRRLHDRFGLSEAEPVREDVVVPPRVPAGV
ncbi:MAG: putative rane protein [Frankiales bacterium]|nr:putative rane protein [Frankiales bacterium]